MSKLELLQKEILALNPEERELISIFIKNNLLSPTPEGYDDAWKAEIRQRIEDMQSGKVKEIKIEDALAEIRANLRK